MEEVIEAFGRDVGAVVMSSESRNILTVDKNCEQLSEEISEIFHSIKARILCITKRARQDLESKVA